MTHYGPLALEEPYLARLTGLAKIVCRAWLLAEGQDVPNDSNPLNIAVAGGGSGSGLETGRLGGFYTYRDWSSGLDAASYLLHLNPAYRGVLDSVTADPISQARAIESSPWAGGHYGAGPGVDGTIVRLVRQFIAAGHQPAPPVPPSSGGGKPMADPFAAAAVTNVGYVRTIATSWGPSYAARLEPYLTKISAQVGVVDGRLTDALAAPQAPVAAAPPTSFDDALARWNDAETAALVAAGKPAATDGGERGSFDQATQIALAQSIGVYEILIGADPNFFGPPPAPGVSA